MTEQELIEQRYTKEMLAIHLQEYDPHPYNDKEIPFRRLSYDIANDFTEDQIAAIQRWVREVNNRFPNIKVTVTGTGYTKKENNEESE